jgi:hypothetical protein
MGRAQTLSLKSFCFFMREKRKTKRFNRRKRCITVSTYVQLPLNGISLSSICAEPRNLSRELAKELFAKLHESIQN